MPIVDYNRIYKMRSQERRPALNPVNVPDAAGARMRAGAPALDAALGIARDRARERGLRDRDKWAAIGNLVGVGAKAGAAYAAALERRDEADLSAMRAAWTNHMNAGAEEAWRRKYSRAGNGVEADGPLRAIIDLDRSFDETGYFTGAREGVRERFQAWRAGARQTYVAKGERLQEEAGAAFRQQAYVADCAAREDGVARLFDPKDDEEYNRAAEATADFEVGTAFKERGLGDFTGEGGAFRFRDDVPPDAPERAEFARLCKEKWRQFDLRRVKHWCALVASDDSAEGKPDLVERIREEIAADKWYTPEERDGMRQLLSAAEKSHERLVAARQDGESDAAYDIVRQIQYGSMPDADLVTLRTEILAHASALPPGRQDKLVSDADEAIGTRQAINWLDRFNEPDANREAMLSELASMPQGVKKDILMKQLYGGSSGRDAGDGPRSRWTPTNARNRLDVGDPPAVVIEKAQRAVADGAMSHADYRAVQDACNARIRFDKATGAKGGEYMAQIVGAVKDAFDVEVSDLFVTDPDTGMPRCDKDGNLFPSADYDPSETRSTSIGRERRRLKSLPFFESDVVDGLEVSESALLDVVRLGMEIVTQRLTGFDGKGGKGSGAPFTPETARAELVEAFRSVASEQGAALSSEALAIAVLRRRRRAEERMTPTLVRQAFDEEFARQNDYPTE